MNGAPVVVSLTPLPAERDTRTLKIAHAFARRGFRSVVVENRPSVRPADYPEIEIISLPSPWPLRKSTSSAESIGRQNGAIAGLLGGAAPGLLREPFHLLGFFFLYGIERPRACLSLVPEADLYYLHEYRMYPLVRSAIRRRPAPFIYDAHDYYPEVIRSAEMSPFRRGCFQPLLNFLERRCIDAADAMVTVGEGVASLYRAQSGRQLTIVRNSHDRALEQSPSRTLRDLTGVGDEEFLIAVVGHRKPGQVVASAFDALAQLPSTVHMAFVGRHHEETRAEAERAGIGGRVHCVGAVAPGSVVPFIRSADAGALLYAPATRNVENALPNGFFQSVSAGLPMLFPPLPEIRTIVGDADIGVVMDPTSTTSIVEAIKSFLNGPRRLEDWRRNVNAFSKTVSWERDEKVLMELAGNLLSPSHARSSS